MHSNRLDSLAQGARGLPDLSSHREHLVNKIAALQKREETFAQKKDAALLDDAADRVAPPAAASQARARWPYIASEQLSICA